MFLRPRRHFVLIPLLIATASAGGCSKFHFPGRLSERECLIRAMYFESIRSSNDGLLAVGTVVMNRVESPHYPDTICGVVGQPRQFARGVLTKPLDQGNVDRVAQIADEVLQGKRHPGVGKVKFFHTANVKMNLRNIRYVTVAGGNAFYERPEPGESFDAHPSVPTPITMIAKADPPPAPPAGARQPLHREPAQVAHPDGISESDRERLTLFLATGVGLN